MRYLYYYLTIADYLATYYHTIADSPTTYYLTSAYYLLSTTDDLLYPLLSAQRWLKGGSKLAHMAFPQRLSPH